MQHFRFNIFFLLISLFLTSLFFQNAVAATPDPTEQLKPFLEKIVTQLKEPEFKEKTVADQCQCIVEMASEHFDFHEMSKRVMGKQWRSLSSKEQGEFVDLFTKLLQYVYIGQVDEYLDKKIEFKQQRIKKNRAEVKTLFVGNNKTIPVSYIMLLKKDQWMAYDIVVEGVSLVRNYMEQIRSVLRDEKFTGLISLLEKKIKKLEAGEEEE
ncbi:MAG: ABC transporter substrate-binding protein [Candidatus Electrothrix sp. AR4]|nr:ABC transporter substrate-binding protein [Candidatus Electrothrix sp. AR4]